MAVDEINAAGGILGKQIRPVILDDQADKNISKANMEQLIFEENAVAVIGPANSANALYWLDLAQDNEMIVISHIATATEITTRFADRPRNYIFRISSLDIEQTRLYVAWLIRKTNNGKIAIIHDNAAYGEKGAKDASEVLASWGKTPVYVGSFEAGASAEEYIPLIESAKEARADGIVLFCYPESTAEFLRVSEYVEDYDPVLVGPAANAVKLWELAGPLSGKMIFAAGVSSDLNERTEELNKKLTDEYGTLPVFSTAAQAYDAVYLLKAAIEDAGTLDRVAVRDALENTRDVQGVIKNYGNAFSKSDHEGISARDISLSHWVDGETVRIDEDLSDLEIR